MNIRPLYDRIVVKRIEEQETTRNGIIIPDSAQEKPQEGEVIAVGHGKRLEDGKLIALDVKIGDRILFGKYSGGREPRAGAAAPHARPARRPLCARRPGRLGRTADEPRRALSRPGAGSLPRALFPLKDNIPTDRTPIVTIVLIAINVFVYLFLQPKTGIDISGDSLQQASLITTGRSRTS